jgi:tetratricopeptide (TPR) repeat protein
VEEIDNAILARWRLPPFPHELAAVEMDKIDVDYLGDVVRRLSNIGDDQRSKTLDWLYRAIRGNVRRGRLFELSDVLAEWEADCLGYAKLMKALGQKFGLDVGVVEVVVDNGGRYVPHAVNILKLASGKWQLVDLWYGSQRINHRRIGALVKEGGEWRVRDIDAGEFESIEDIAGLPDGCIDAITYYIRGNRHLNGGELDEAISCYTKAISLYPTNARLYFNRAVAYDGRGEHEEAAQDYALALKDEDSLIRVLAREHEEITGLIALDEKGIDLRDQGIYLLRRGFVSGEEVGEEEVARWYGISEEEVARVVLWVESLVGK